MPRGQTHVSFIHQTSKATSIQHQRLRRKAGQERSNWLSNKTQEASAILYLKLKTKAFPWLRTLSERTRAIYTLPESEWQDDTKPKHTLLLPSASPAPCRSHFSLKQRSFQRFFIRQEEVTDKRMKGLLYQMSTTAVENQYTGSPGKKQGGMEHIKPTNTWLVPWEHNTIFLTCEHLAEGAENEGLLAMQCKLG